MTCFRGELHQPSALTSNWTRPGATSEGMGIIWAPPIVTVRFDLQRRKFRPRARLDDLICPPDGCKISRELIEPEPMMAQCASRRTDISGAATNRPTPLSEESAWRPEHGPTLSQAAALTEVGTSVSVMRNPVTESKSCMSRGDTSMLRLAPNVKGCRPSTWITSGLPATSAWIC